MNELKWIADNTADAAKRAAQHSIAEVRSETSLVNAVSKNTNDAVQHVQSAQPDDGVYVANSKYEARQFMAENTSYKTMKGVPDIKVTPPRRTAKHYSRVLPEQTMRVAPDYNKNKVRRVLSGVILALALLGVVYLVLKYVFHQPVWPF